MSCKHPFDRLVYSSWFRQGGQVVHERVITCELCGELIHVGHHVTPQMFVEVRKVLFENQTHEDPDLWRDMFYRPIDVGSEIVYPALSGRSAQLVPGVILEMNPDRKDRYYGPFTQEEKYEMMSKGRLGQPYKLKVQPVGSGSRWVQGYSKNQRAVTLSANAGSAVLVEFP